MISPTLDSLRIFLHILAASVWVGGQIVLGGLVPSVRKSNPEALKPIANAFGRVGRRDRGRGRRPHRRDRHVEPAQRRCHGHGLELSRHIGREDRRCHAGGIRRGRACEHQEQTRARPWWRNRTCRLARRPVLGRIARRSELVPIFQFLGTWLHGTSRSTRASPGRPSTRSPRMFFITSVVPPSIEFARLRRKAFW